MITVLSEDGVIQYTVKGDTIVSAKLLKLPKDPFTIRFPLYIDKIKIRTIGEGSKVLIGSTEIHSEYMSRREDISIEIDDGIEHISSSAFVQVNAKSVHWPASCKYIPKSCFEACQIDELTGIEKIQFIQARSFWCARINSPIIFSDSLTIIENQAFEYCNAPEIVVGKNVSHIGDFAFAYSGIKEFVWPDECNTIPNGCFKTCAVLKRISNIDTVKEISCGAFRNCTELSEFNFSDNLLSIGGMAFAYSGLSKADLSQTSVEHIGAGAFTGIKDPSAFIPNTMCVMDNKLM